MKECCNFQKKKFSHQELAKETKNCAYINIYNIYELRILSVTCVIFSYIFCFILNEKVLSL